MDVNAVEPLAKQLGFVERSLRPILGGWASWTFDVAASDGSPWILRIARTAEINAAHRREERLLPLLHKTLSFAVPLPEHGGDWNEHRYLAYRKLAGRPLRTGDRQVAVAGMLRELHAFPVDVAAAALGPTGSWREEYVRLREKFEQAAIRRLDAELAAAVRREYDRFLAGPMDFTTALVHRDLGTEHILVDPATRTPTGMIDFEDATIGDPAIDFVGILITFGDVVTDEILAAYDSPIDLDRLRFYWWLGALHALDYGVETNDEQLIRDAVDGLRNRLNALGPRL